SGPSRAVGPGSTVPPGSASARESHACGDDGGCSVGRFAWTSRSSSVVALERDASGRFAKYRRGSPTPDRSPETGLAGFDARESVTRGPSDAAVGKTAVI